MPQFRHLFQECPRVLIFFSGDSNELYNVVVMTYLALDYAIPFLQPYHVRVQWCMVLLMKNGREEERERHQKWYFRLLLETQYTGTWQAWYYSPHHKKPLLMLKMRRSLTVLISSADIDPGRSCLLANTKRVAPANRCGQSLCLEQLLTGVMTQF